MSAPTRPTSSPRPLSAALLLLCCAPALAQSVGPGAGAPTGPEGAPPPSAAQPSAPQPEPQPPAAQGEAPATAGAPRPEPHHKPPPLPPVPTPTEPTPGPDAAMAGAPPDVPLPPDERERPDSWLDAGHARLERLLFRPVIEFDRFFSDERDLDAERERSFIRLRTEVELQQRRTPHPAAGLRASLRFPGLGEWMDRFRLVISGDTDVETQNALFPEDPALRSRESRRANAELRLGAWRGLLASVDVGAGVLFIIPPGVFVRARYRAELPLTELFLTRLAVTPYWQSNTGPGTRVTLGMERPFGRTTLVRLSSSGDVNQRDTRGIEFGSELALLQALGPRRAVAVGGTLEGASRSPAPVDRYRVFTRYRQDIFRRWLFVELEPEVIWPWATASAYRTTFGVILRAEVQFQGTEAD